MRPQIAAALKADAAVKWNHADGLQQMENSFWTAWEKQTV